MHAEVAYWKGMTWIVVTYFTAFCVALLTGWVLPSSDPVVVALVADVAATLAVFAFSVVFRNASLYDPYWSVAPIVIVAYWALVGGVDANPLRQALCVGGVAFWGTRLTTNWGTGWKGLGHEDWRYVQLARQTGVFWPVVNLLGIHLFPTLLVFAALRPAYDAVTSSAPLGPLDVLAAVVVVGATVLEATADLQLRAFHLRNRNPEAFVDEGLWRWSRHPNYLGEILFWWGLWIFGVATGPKAWWMLAGAVGVSVLFRFVSIPLMERRLLVRRPTYAVQQKLVPMLLPWPPGARRVSAAPPDEPQHDLGTTPGDPIVTREARLAIDTMPVVPPPPRDDA